MPRVCCNLLMAKSLAPALPAGMACALSESGDRTESRFDITSKGFGLLGGTETPAGSWTQEGSTMKIRRFATHSIAGVLVLMSFSSSPVMAQSDHSHAAAAHATDFSVC